MPGAIGAAVDAGTAGLQPVSYPHPLPGRDGEPPVEGVAGERVVGEVVAEEGLAGVVVGDDDVVGGERCHAADRVLQPEDLLLTHVVAKDARVSADAARMAVSRALKKLTDRLKTPPPA